jgi:hypothetical protein
MFLLLFKIKEKIRSIVNHFKKVRIRVVHEEDLAKLLSSLGVLEIIKDSKVNCLYCGGIVSLDNLEAILKEDGAIKFVCSKNECISKL